MQSLALEIRRDKLVQKERWRHIVSKEQGHVAVFLYEIPYQTVLAAIIHPLEGYVVIRTKITVYCKSGVSELKFERYAW